MDTYYNPEDLGQFCKDGIGSYAGELFDKGMAYYGAVFQDGALTSREKSLIALGVAIAIECPYCIDAHTNSLLSKGCTPDQIMEVYHAAAAIGYGASIAHAAQSLNIIEDNEL